MKALVKKHAERGLWLEDVPEPACGINHVLIRVDRTGICGTDLHIHKWDAWAQKTIPVPMVVGHEFVGKVVEIGSNVHDFKVGDVVGGEGHVVCGHCRNCMAGRRHLCKDTQGVGVNRAGAFAEYIALPQTNVWYHADDIDVNPYRLGLARKMGATLAIDVRESSIADAQKDLGMQEGFDVGLEMSGNEQAFQDMITNMAHGGKISMLGIPQKPMAVDWNEVIFNMLTIKGIYGREMYETWYKMTVMLQSGLDISPVITHRLSYDDFESGFDAMYSGDAAKVILDWKNA